LSTEADDLRDLVHRALARDQLSVRALVDRLSPVIERRVAATLWRTGGRRDIRQELQDMVQAVFLSLFESDGKALRAWDPLRGCSLEGFVGLLAQRQTISILRRGRTSPWPDEPTDDAELDTLSAATRFPEEILGSREHLRLLLDRVHEDLSPVGQEMFQRLVIDEEPLEEVAVRVGKSVAALYQWKSRLIRRLRELSAELLADSASDRALARRNEKESSHR
jgi:RNA polymerase sigma-70 factor (ECF subfamily)